MPTEHLAGAVVYARQGGGDVPRIRPRHLRALDDIQGQGRGREDVRAGAIREIQEEMGLNIKIVEELGVNEYIVNDSKVEGGKKKKRVTYFSPSRPSPI